MRFNYSYDQWEEDGELEHCFLITDAVLGIDNPIAWTEDRDQAEKIVKALNMVFAGPFALDTIPGCVTKEIG